VWSFGAVRGTDDCKRLPSLGNGHFFALDNPIGNLGETIPKIGYRGCFHDMNPHVVKEASLGLRTRFCCLALTFMASLSEIQLVCLTFFIKFAHYAALL
jgi:hypothetical protein